MKRVRCIATDTAVTLQRTHETSLIHCNKHVVTVHEAYCGRSIYNGCFGCEITSNEFQGDWRGVFAIYSVLLLISAALGTLCAIHYGVAALVSTCFVNCRERQDTGVHRKLYSGSVSVNKSTCCNAAV